MPVRRVVTFNFRWVCLISLIGKIFDCCFLNLCILIRLALGLIGIYEQLEHRHFVFFLFHTDCRMIDSGLTLLGRYVSAIAIAAASPLVALIFVWVGRCLVSSALAVLYSRLTLSRGGLSDGWSHIFRLQRRSSLFRRKPRAADWGARQISWWLETPVLVKTYSNWLCARAGWR